MILVDTSVLIDVTKGDPNWQAWSSEALTRALSEDLLAINDVIYAELSIGYTSVEELDEAVDSLGLQPVRMTNAALFLAARAHTRYRAQGGTRTGVLSDFFVGAQAATENARLLTRDPARIREYFPTVRLITP